MFKKSVLTQEEFQEKFMKKKKHYSIEELEEIDALVGLMTTSDLKRLQVVKDLHNRQYGYSANLSKYQKFVLTCEDIYLYTLAKYNSKTRARKVAAIFMGEPLSDIELNQWRDNDPEMEGRYKEAIQAFRDSIREEIVRRALIGVDKPVFDRDGNHIKDIKIKSDKLLEKMLTANCDEYKEKTEIQGISAGAITFNVVNFAAEQEETARRITEQND